MAIGQPISMVDARQRVMGTIDYTLNLRVPGALVIPNAALFRTSGTGISWPGSGATGDPSRTDVPYPQAGFFVRRDLSPVMAVERILRARAALRDGLAVYLTGDIPWSGPNSMWSAPGSAGAHRASQRTG